MEQTELISKCKVLYSKFVEMIEEYTANTTPTTQTIVNDLDSVCTLIREMFHMVNGTVKAKGDSGMLTFSVKYDGGIYLDGQEPYTIGGIVIVMANHKPGEKCYKGDLYRCAEDLTMAYYRTNGGEGYNTYSFMDMIR